MSWIIIGGRECANFACDTGMTAFGPLHTNYGYGSAREDLQDFAESLSRDPRKYDEPVLAEKYHVWWNSR